MKRFISKIALLLCSLMIIAGCEDVIQIKLDEGSRLYVIDAFVNDLRMDQVIRVTTNDSYFSNNAPPPVPNAEVVLSDLTLNKQYVFAYKGNGDYQYSLSGGDTIARVGHQYRLEVKIDGFTYSSFTTQKRTAKIDSIAALPAEGFGLEPAPEEKVYSCLLFARDKADNNPDYYWIKTFRNDTLFKDPVDLNIAVDGTGGAVMNAPIDSIDFTPPATYLGFRTYRPGDKCRVEIHSLSRDNYYFFMQAYYQINNSGLFATTPENVKTNIVTPAGAKIKAVGRFNMASVTGLEKVIP